MGKTVICGSFQHETNTFVQDTTDRTDFRHREEYFGSDVEANLAGTETQVGGVIEADQETDIDVDVIHTVAALATPGGRVERETYEFYAETILDGIRENLEDLDGVILPLHGAMVAEHITDGEGELVDRVRELVGPDVPIVVTLDLHGNVSERLVDVADAVIGFETYPHLDKRDTGRRGMEILLDAVVADVSPTTRLESVPMIIYQPRAHTESGPFVAIQDCARELEERDGVLKVTVFAGFYHADIPEMGVSVVVVADGDPSLADECAADLGATLWNRRDEFIKEYPKPAEAVRTAKERRLELDDDAGPIVMADFGSNPGGGGAANGTTILREMIDQGLEGAGWAIMHDPEAVADCVDAGVRNRVVTTVGGKTDDRHGDPIEGLDGYVKAITDGRYVNTGTSHSGQGVQNDIGTTVCFKCGADDGVTVILAERRQSAFDAEIWRHVGVQPERMNYICIPSLIAFLGDYGPIASDVLLVDTPGASAVNPARFEYEHIPRPVYPLDDANSIEYPN